MALSLKCLNVATSRDRVLGNYSPHLCFLPISPLGLEAMSGARNWGFPICCPQGAHASQALGRLDEDGPAD